MVAEEKTLNSVLSNDNLGLASTKVNTQNVIAASTLGLAFPKVHIYLLIPTVHQIDSLQVQRPQGRNIIQRRHNLDILVCEQA